MAIDGGVVLEYDGRPNEEPQRYRRALAGGEMR